MANLQRVVISLLFVLTAGFLFLAQTSEAAKGPKITHKASQNRNQRDSDRATDPNHRFTLISLTAMNHLEGSSLVSMARLCLRLQRTSVPWRPAKRASGTKAQPFTASSKVSCARVVILPTATVRVSARAVGGPTDCEPRDWWEIHLWREIRRREFQIDP